MPEWRYNVGAHAHLSHQGIQAPSPAQDCRAPAAARAVERRIARKLTLISAAAGFGKTTLASEWAAACGLPAAWLSLDEGDNDPARFLAYLIAALQTVAPPVGQGALAALQPRSRRPPRRS